MFQNSLVCRVVFCWMIVVLVPIHTAVTDKAANAAPADTDSDDASERYLVPEALKDLKRDYKILPIYFVPRDRKAVANYRKKITVLLTFVADLYRRDLLSKGYKTRGLDFQFKDGQLDVRLVRGERKAAFYSGEPKYDKNRLWNTVSAELVKNKKVGHPIRRLYMVLTETQGKGPVDGRFPGENAESAPVHPYSGFALVSAWMLHDQIAGTSVEQHLRFMNDPTPIKNVKPGGKDRPRMELSQAAAGLLAHEMAHPMFLLHDQTDQRNIMCFGYNQLRKSFLKATAKKQPVRFSDNHARMLSRSRYVSESFDKNDGTSPKISFKLAKPPQPGDRQVRFTLEASDAAGLAAILYYESTLDSVVAGVAVQGKSYKTQGVLHRPPLRPGQLLHYKVLAIDINGNVEVSILGYRVPAENVSKRQKDAAKP